MSWQLNGVFFMSLGGWDREEDDARGVIHVRLISGGWRHEVWYVF